MNIVKMESIETKIKAILNGLIIDDEDKEFLKVNIDYTLEEQNVELVTKGQNVESINEFKPKIGVSITYIVAAVIFNEKNEVLMIQEAKSRCAGSWYLPAGRVEPDDANFESAITREVHEETGLNFVPKTLLKIESSLGTWYRFVYTGQVTGGQLKTIANADQESLQALYVADVTKLNLRSNDCLKLIELGQEYIQLRQEWYPPQLVINRTVPNIFLRLLIGIIDSRKKTYNVLLSNLLVPHLPICEINPTRSIHSTLKRFMQHIFGADRLPNHRPYGLLAVENGRSSQSDQPDGVCLTLLVMCKDSIDSVQIRDGFSWKELNNNLKGVLLSKLSARHKLLIYSVL